MGITEPAATRYVVLWQPNDTSTRAQWTYHGEWDAKSAEGAIRKSAGDETPTNPGGTYVAVPARSWKPMRVEQVQTVQTVITPTAADDTTASNSKNAPESEIRAVEAEAEES